jgi:tetratricopeptide (TPR) repeat protein
MRIICTILLGPGSEATVPDGIRSLNPVVDEFLLIESGGGGAALRAAYETVEKLATTAHYTWTGDYGAARQFALDKVREMGADYALTLDPDERLVGAETIRETVAANPYSDVFIARDQTEGYWKERVIKCSAPLEWRGRVCEMLSGNRTPQVKLRAQFWEVPKDEDAHRRRFERGVIECQRMIDEGDDCHRWRRHLGACLMGLGRREEAKAHYQKAFDLATHDEEKAWTWYLLCEQTVLDGDLEKAMRDAAVGLVDHAGFLPEFAWIIAYCQMRAGNLQNASRWAQLGAQCPDDKTRLSFRGANARKGCREILAKLHEPVAPGFSGAVFESRKEFALNYQRLARALTETLRFPLRHLDLGAGHGLLVEAMRDLRVVSHGVELSEGAREATREDIRAFMDYGVGADEWHRFTDANLVSCVEVLEHLPESEADAAVSAICGRSTEWVYFSAAAPGQPGNGHINCQPKPYWRAKFEANGFRFAEAETARLVGEIKDMQPCFWLPQNAMIFRKVETP